MHFHTVGQVHDDDVVLAQPLQVKQGAEATDLRQQLRPCPALGIVAAEPAVKAASARRAMLVSRFNTILSIPMLYLMSAQSHGGL